MVLYLEKRGLSIQWEESFWPHQVDIYLPDFHAVIEVDGPLHDKQKDTKRDLVLVEDYSLRIHRIPAKDVRVPMRWWPGTATFLQQCRFSAEARLELYHDL